MVTLPAARYRGRFTSTGLLSDSGLIRDAVGLGLINPKIRAAFTDRRKYGRQEDAVTRSQARNPKNVTHREVHYWYYFYTSESHCCINIIKNK